MTSAGGKRFDAVVVGAGPNGLAAAIAIARTARKVLVIEANDTIGGATRSAELTLPGFVHDVCSGIHPLTIGSPFLSKLPLADFGLEWVHPGVPLAHPMDDGTAVVLERSLVETAASLGQDGEAWQRLMGPVVRHWDTIADGVLGPLRLLRLLRHPLVMARFGLDALRSARDLAERHFRLERAKALFAGMAAHSFLKLEGHPSAAFGLVLGVTGHAVGWPMPRGGAQAIPAAMAAYLQSLGGEIVTGRRVHSLDGLPPSTAVLLDLTPRQVLRVAGSRLPRWYRRKLSGYRYGPGVFKVDWALEGPIPWTAPDCARAGTVHLGGTLDEISASERVVWEGSVAERPFVLLAQHSLFDSSRAPQGKHTAWAYCHVPNGSNLDMTASIEAQVERYAPGFQKRILARYTAGPAEMEQGNANLIGGDINGGVQDLRQLFTRPMFRPVPYSTPAEGLYICSSSTPPGGGVHGMCGYFAAQAALRGL